MTSQLADDVAALLAGPRPLPIVTAGHPVLRIPAAPYDGQLDDTVLIELLGAMRETMHAAPGVGLAAPQIGIGLQIAVAEDSGEVLPAIADARDRRGLDYLVLINPEYSALGDGRAVFFEGCLSVSGYQAVVDRPAAVSLTRLDETGALAVEEFYGWSARIVQHETDHLAGTLYLDKALLRSLTDLGNYQQWWAGPSVEPARRFLGF